MEVYYLASHTASSSTTEHDRVIDLILLGILVGLLILSVRPFGFRTFLCGLEHNNIYSLLLMICIVGVCLTILQRAGVIFSDNTYAW